MPSEMLRFRCPACSQEMAASPQHAGQTTSCVKCKERLLIPGAAPNPPTAIPVLPQAIPISPPTREGKAPAEMDALTVASLICTVGSAACLFLPFLWMVSVPLGACGIVLGFTAGHYAAHKGRRASRVIFWCILVSFLSLGFALISLKIVADDVKSLNRQFKEMQEVDF